MSTTIGYRLLSRWRAKRELLHLYYNINNSATFVSDTLSHSNLVDGQSMLKPPEELLNQLLRTGAIPPNTVSGCAMEEIDALETAFSIELPATFKQFLMVMGKVENSRDGFFQEYWPFDLGTEEDYIQCRNEAASRLKDRGHKLTDSDFVFLSSSNGCWCWFDTNCGTDPAVNLVMDDAEEVHLNEWGSFLAFLNYVAEDFLSNDLIECEEG